MASTTARPTASPAANSAAGRAVLAVTPYATAPEREAALTTLASAGCQREQTDTVGGSLGAIKWNGWWVSRCEFRQ